MAPAVNSRPRRNGGPGSIPDQIRVRFVMDKVAPEQVYFFSVLPLSVSFNQCFVLTIYMVHIPEGQTSETWEPSRSNALFSWIQLSLNFFTLTLRRLMSYIYGAPILDVSRSHTTTHHSR